MMVDSSATTGRRWASAVATGSAILSMPPGSSVGLARSAGDSCADALEIFPGDAIGGVAEVAGDFRRAGFGDHFIDVDHRQHRQDVAYPIGSAAALEAHRALSK